MSYSKYVKKDMGEEMKYSRLMMAVFVAIFALMISSAVSGQTRIQFEKGKSSAVVKASTGTNGVYYVVRAKSGQKIVLTLTPVSNVGIKVETDGSDGQQVLLREEKGGTYEVGLEESGDYTIFIGSINHKAVAFTLTVKITKMTDV
jgi:hypothetical protein